MNYTYGTVPAASIAGMAVSGLVSLILPVALLLIWKKKTNAKVSAFYAGCLTFLIFAMLLEPVLHNVVLGAAGNYLENNIILYALYGGLAAGLFEEVGRWIVMTFFMKKTLSRENAVMHGIGHGGIEAIVICTVSEISNIAAALSVNSGAIDAVLKQTPEGPMRDQLFEQISALWTTDSSLFYFAGIERIAAIVFHICASYIVYLAVSKKKFGYCVLAIFLHAFVDTASVLMNGYGVPIPVIEGFLVLYSAVLLFLVVKDYRRYR